MAAFLITGNPGSGKTTVARELTRRGLTAVDGDALAGWETPSGVEVMRPKDATEEWGLAHRWVWARARVHEAIQAPATGGHTFLCGIAMNQRELLDLFQGCFLLTLDHATQLRRLDAQGIREPALRAQILGGRPFLEDEMKAVGALVVDGRQATSTIVTRILCDVAELATADKRQGLGDEDMCRSADVVAHPGWARTAAFLDNAPAGDSGVCFRPVRVRRGC